MKYLKQEFVFLPRPKVVSIKDRIICKIFSFLPYYITPNIITTFRLITIPISIYLFVLEMYWVAFILFTISAFSDMLDGPIARYRGQITHFGEKYDPFADILLILSTGLLLYNIDTFKYFYLYLLMEIIRLLITPILYKYIYKIKLHQYSGVFGKIKMFLISSSLWLSFIYLLSDYSLATQLSNTIALLSILFLILDILFHNTHLKRYV